LIGPAGENTAALAAEAPIATATPTAAHAADRRLIVVAEVRI
jgi:hypothetical protein